MWQFERLIRASAIALVVVGMTLGLACDKVSGPEAVEDVSAKNGIHGEPATGAVDFKLYQNAPDPFASSTLIRFDLQKRLHVTLNVEALGGVTKVLDELRDAGSHYIIFTPPEGMRTGPHKYFLHVNGKYLGKVMTYEGGE